MVVKFLFGSCLFRLNKREFCKRGTCHCKTVMLNIIVSNVLIDLCFFLLSVSIIGKKDLLTSQKRLLIIMPVMIMAEVF